MEAVYDPTTANIKVLNWRYNTDGIGFSSNLPRELGG